MSRVTLHDSHGATLAVDSAHAHTLEALGWKRGKATPPTKADADKAEAVVTTAPETLPQAGDEAEDPYEGWTKEELKAEAKERGLPVSGTVDELVERLLDDDEQAE